MTLAARVNAHAAQGEPAGLQNGQCEFCERKGLPILPVRYAVCQRNGRNRPIPELPAERIQEFTDIGLDKAWDENGEYTRIVDDEVRPLITDGTSKVNKYILRQLRQGYLYLYDQDNPDGMYWYAYAITSDGKYYQFPVARPPSLESTEFPCQDKANDALHASLVTLPNPDNSGTLYYAFSEHAWPIEHIRRIGSDQAWRDRHMQQIDIRSWVAGQSQPFAYGTDELSMVAEYSEGADDLGTQFWSSGPKRDLYSREDLKDAMDLRLDHAASRYQGRGLILAVKDEAGIIDELNAYRHQALAEVEDFVCESDDNRRKLLCKQAIDAFKENFAENYTTSQKKSLDEAVDKARSERDAFQEKSHSDDDVSRRERAQAQRTRNQLNHAVREAEAERENFLLEQQRGAEERAHQKRQLQAEIEELKRLKAEREETLARRAASRDESVAGQAEVLQQDPFYDNEIQRKQFLINSVKSEAERMAEKHAAQLDELYDTKALKEFTDSHKERTRVCEALLTLHDSDYALWVKHHLDDVIGRYSQSDYWMGLGLSGLLANALRGGILSPASGRLWQSMAATMTAEGSMILAALFSSNAELMRQARDTMASVPAGSQLSTDTLAAWGDRFGTLQASTLTLRQRPPSSDELINRLRPIQGQLANTIGNAIATLVAQDLISGTDNDSKPTLRRFMHLEQLVFMSDPDVQKGEAPPPELIEVTLTMAQYAHWQQQIVRHYQDSAKSQGADTDRAMPSLGRGGGNFSAPMGDNGVVMTVTIPCFGLDPATVQRLIANGAPGDSYDAEQARQQWADLALSARNVAGTIAGSGSYGKLLAFGLTSWNLLLAVDQELLADENSGADWNRLLGSAVSLLSAGMGAAEGYRAIRVASLGPGAEGALGRLVNASGWKLGGGLLGVASGTLSIWDGLRKLTESSRARRLGQNLTADKKRIMGGFGVLSGIGTMLVIGAGLAVGLAVGLFFGILALLLGAWLITLVAPSVQMWIDRSLVGYHTSQVQPFDDLGSEQSSLEMVFQGLVVELSWEPAAPDATKYFDSTSSGGGMLGFSIDSEARREEEERVEDFVRINLKVRVPKLGSINLGMRLVAKGSGEALLDWIYQKNRGSELLTAGAGRGSLPDNGSDHRPEFTLKDNAYEMRWSQVYAKNVLTQLIDLTIDFKSIDTNSFSRDLLAMKIEDPENEWERTE